MANVKWKDIVEAAAHNDMEAVKYFVEQKHVPMETCNADEQTAAHIALQNGNLELLKYLVKKDPSIVTATDKKGRPILIQAVDQGTLDPIKFLLEECHENVAYEHNRYYGNTAVHMAALRNQFDILKYFLDDQNIDVDIRSDFRETPLFLAVEKAHMPIVKYLVEEKKAKISATDNNEDNILYMSARNGDLQVPRYILDEQKRKIDLNKRDFFGETILHRAVKFNRLHFIEYLIEEKGVRVNIRDTDGKTPLHHAAENGNLTIVTYLCENGASTDIKNEYNQTALEAAKNPVVVEYLTTVTWNNSNSDSDSELRRRRSVTGDTTFQIYGWGEKIVAGVLSWSNVRLLGDGFVFPESEISSFNSALTFVGAFLKYSTVVGYVHAHDFLLSPSEILQRRMDPIAVDAVTEVLDIKDP